FHGKTLLVFTSRAWSATISSSPTPSPLTFRTCGSLSNTEVGTGSAGTAVSCGPRTATECRPYLAQTNLEADRQCWVGTAVTCGPRTATECLPVHKNLEADDILPSRFFDQVHDSRQPFFAGKAIHGRKKFLKTSEPFFSFDLDQSFFVPLPRF